MKSLLQKPYLLIAGLILVAAFGLRWINMPDVLFFGFEQGRDALIAQDIRENLTIKLVGPKTDLTGIFHGVWWYYGLAVLYGIGQGSPEFVLFSLVLLQVGTILVLGRLIFELTKEKWLSLLGMAYLTISYEHILFSRWVSNVSPAYFLIPVSILFLFRFLRERKTTQLVLAAGTATLAAQFQIALIFPIGLFGVLLLLTRTIKITRKQAALSLIAISIWFLPLLAFNLRHDFQTIRATHQFLLTPEEGMGSRGLIDSSQTWVRGFRALFSDALGEKGELVVILGLLAIVISARFSRSSPLDPSAISTGKVVAMLLASFIIYLPFESFSAVTHIKPGFSAVVILGYILIIQLLYSLKTVKLLPIVLIALPFATFPTTITHLQEHTNVFYSTIQDDLRLDHQLELLAWIEKDSSGQPYEFRAFTIPYFQEEGWRYLRDSKGYVSTGGTEYIYIIIEEKVDPYWEETWISEYGPTELISTTEVGRLRAIKLKRISTEQD